MVGTGGLRGVAASRLRYSITRPAMLALERISPEFGNDFDTDCNVVLSKNKGWIARNGHDATILVRGKMRLE